MQVEKLKKTPKISKKVESAMQKAEPLPKPELEQEPRRQMTYDEFQRKEDEEYERDVGKQKVVNLQWNFVKQRKGEWA